MKYGYNFDPKTMYQPAIPDIEKFEVPLFGGVFIYRDGRVENTGEYGSEHTMINGYNNYLVGGGSFKSYQQAGKYFWPKYPPGFTDIDHISRVRSDDSWANLRRVNRSLNNLNQTRENVKGYYFEDGEWLKKINGYRFRDGKPPLILKEPPRNKYISKIGYQGKTYELGVHDSGREATQCYLDSKEAFIQDRIRESWIKFLLQ